MLESSFCFFNPFTSFLNLFSCLKFFKSQNWSWTNSARLLELLRRIEVNEFDFPRMAVNLVAQVVRLDVSMRNTGRVQILHRSCSTLEGYQDPMIVNKFLLRRLLQGLAQQLHEKCRIRHFIRRKHLCNVQMLACFHDLELAKKLVHRLLIALWVLDAFQGHSGSLCFQGAWKHRPCCTCGQQTIAGKDVWPVIGVGRCILWFDLGRIVAWWLLTKKHGQSLWLSYPLWLLGPGIVKKTLYFVCGRPWATCSMMEVVSKPFWFGEHFCNRRCLRNANNVSEPLATSRFGSKYVNT